MAGVVVIYYSKFGARLYAHEKATLFDVAAMIAKLKGCEIAGSYDPASNYPSKIFFVPGDTLVAEEASSLDICSLDDLFGGIVPYPVVRTKAITHQLVSGNAYRPEGWSPVFARGVQNVVLRGYTAFTTNDARVAAARLLTQGAVRVKQALRDGGKDQTVITGIGELDELLETLSVETIATFGLVLEENLRRVTTLSVGQVTVDQLKITYQGTQRTVVNNKGEHVYGGSHLFCVRGGWEALDRVPMSPVVRRGVTQARTYDRAASEFPGFLASRRNYDVGQGLDGEGHWRSGVFEASWRCGGASTAELAALTAFAQDPSLHVFEASTVKDFGRAREAPRHALIHFEGDDPEEGPILRYTLVKQHYVRLREGLVTELPSALARQWASP
jgi:hypothetical protein